jgi:hypothetical protein
MIRSINKLVNLSVRPYVRPISRNFSISRPKSDEKIISKMVEEYKQKQKEEEQMVKYSETWTYNIVSTIGLCSNFLIGMVGMGSPVAVGMGLCGAIASFYPKLSVQILGCFGNWMFLLVYVISY